MARRLFEDRELSFKEGQRPEEELFWSEEKEFSVTSSGLSSSGDDGLSDDLSSSEDDSLSDNLSSSEEEEEEEEEEQEEDKLSREDITSVPPVAVRPKKRKRLENEILLKHLAGLEESQHVLQQKLAQPKDFCSSFGDTIADILRKVPEEQRIAIMRATINKMYDYLSIYAKN